MPGFEELRPALFTITGNYIRRHPEEDFWEVLNEIWLSKPMQKITDVRMSWQAAQWGLADYIRRKAGNGCFRQPIKKRQAHLCSLSDLDESYLSELAGSGNEYDSIDAKDLDQWIRRWLCERDRIVVFCRMRGETLEAIGRKIGISKERTRQIFNEAQERLRKRLSA
jgi:RNA polymerase sigma factor (sigma-70 family)